MKRFFIITVVLILLTAIAVTASAATGMSASNAVGKAGQTVEITLSIDGSLKGDQVSVEYDYDDKLLTPQPAVSKWYSKGEISNFHDIKNVGAWGASNPIELKGKLCSLSFVVKPGASFETTEVSCTVTVFSDEKEMAKYTATGKVSTTCIHSYGLWESTGEFNHERSCTVCGEKQIGGHRWDDGTQKADSDNYNKSWMVYTCTVCNVTKEIPMEGVHTPATEPDSTVPSATEDPDNNNPSKPSDPQPEKDPFTGEIENGGDSTPIIGTAPQPERDPFTGEIVNKEEPTEPTQSFVDYNEPEHTHPETTAPMYIEHDHDHTDTATEEDRAVGGYVALAVGLVILGILVYVVKRKS